MLLQALLDNGVYDIDNPSLGYLLQLSLPDEDEDRCFYDKMGILEDQGMGTSQSFTLAPRQPPSPEMLAFLRLMNVQGTAPLLQDVRCLLPCNCPGAHAQAPAGCAACLPCAFMHAQDHVSSSASSPWWLNAGPDAFLMESVFRMEAWGFMLQPVSRENEEAVCDSMVAGCEAAVASYGTSLAEDIKENALLKEGDMSPAALALRVRMVGTTYLISRAKVSEFEPFRAA